MDFKLIISELSEAGYTQKQMATACNCAQPSISDLANGKTKIPNANIGMALIAMHKKAMRKRKAA